MNSTKDELLIDCIKQFEHIENVLGYNRLTTTRSLINEINQALTIPDVVGQSEQLVSFLCQYQKSCEIMHVNKIDAKNFVEQYKTN